MLCFDLWFLPSTAQLNPEFENYLLTSSKPAGVVRVADITELGWMLGEFAISTGEMKRGELFF